MTAVDSPEKILFASTTQAFLHKEAPLRRVRELHEAALSFDPKWWRRAAELGWTALLVPEELGGGSVSDSGVEDLAMVAEQLGKTVAPGPLYPVSVVLAALAECADSQAHADTIESLMSGATVASWAVCEPDRGWAPLDPSVTATETDAGFSISGTKDRVEAGAQSAVLLVVARCGPNGDDIRQFLVPTDAPGVRITPQQSVDLVKQYARVDFDEVVVERSAAVGDAATSAALIDRQSQIAQVLACAEVVGIVQTVFDFTVQWALDRYTFGRPLASYQALKHRFADMKMWLEACRATTVAA
ncbi:MAG: acyl-CoA dehydrogenase family protein, partial [Mycobacterium sp.]